MEEKRMGKHKEIKNKNEDGRQEWRSLEECEK